MRKAPHTIVGLDIGTTKVCALVGQVHQDGIDIIGCGSQPSRGLKKGNIINMESTVDAIKRAVEEAETMVGFDIRSVTTGIAGNHIKGFQSNGAIAIKDRQIKKTDIRQVLDAAKAVVIPMDREVIHILPQEFIVDDQDGIKDPMGMAGVRLEARVHIVTGAVTSAQNIIRCANRTGLNVSDLVLQQLASSESVLTDDEKELGVVFVDLGGGTTDLAIFCKGSICYTTVLPLGGDHITSDIAIGIRTPISAAEEIKKNHGCALSYMVDEKELIEVPGIGINTSRTITRQTLCQIIEPRMEEIFNLIHKEILKSGYKEFLASGLVLTGGTSLLKGISAMGEKVLGLPIRIGCPQRVGGLSDIVCNPIFSTGVGLLLFGKQQQTNGFHDRVGSTPLGKVGRKMRKWFEEAF